MEHERRALYTSLRLNWLRDPTIPVDDWQVEDYREMPFSVLFERLKTHGIHLDRISFLAYANQHSSPEELCDELLNQRKVESKVYDQIYLIVFELWRRFVNDKPCLSIFCDEIDHQIYIYDEGDIDNSEQIQDIIANLQVILEENADQGVDPISVFEYVSAGCAHDIESFLLDYIADLIDNANFSYAAELIEGFSEYIQDHKWFNLQRIRLIAQNEPRTANRLIVQLLEDHQEDEDKLDFVLEILHFLATEGDGSLFKDMLVKVFPLLESEEDFQDLIDICLEFHQNRDNDGKVNALQTMQAKRREKNVDAPLDPSDNALSRLRQLMTN